MSTDRQIAANQQNAQKSTGPKTGRGKATSAQNARRHGLTGALARDAVLSWYRIILEDETAVPDPFEEDPHLRAAADLARAEAQLQRVRRAEEEWLLGPKAPPTRRGPPSNIEKSLLEDQDRLIDALVEDALGRKRLRVAREGRFLREPFRRPADSEELDRTLEEHARDPTIDVGWDRKGFRLLRRLDKAIQRVRQAGQVDHKMEGRTLARYRTLAEARRRAALRRWIEETAKRSQSTRGS